MAKGTGKPVAVRKDKDGDISHIQFANRQKMTPLDQAISLTKQGLTEAVRVNQTCQGREYLQDIPDSSTKDNLQNFPRNK